MTARLIEGAIEIHCSANVGCDKKLVFKDMTAREAKSASRAKGWMPYFGAHMELDYCPEHSKGLIY